MPKGKLRIKKSDGKKFKTAAGIFDLKVGAAKPVGDEVITEVTYSSIQQIADVFTKMPDLKGDELDEPKEEKGK